MHAMPSETQLESVARKLFAEGPPVEGRQLVMREDVSVLIRLFLSLRLEERRWATRCHFGNLVEAESGEEDLTEVLVDALAGDDSGQTMITFQELVRAIELMPNLLLRFQQLWAVIFQPPSATDMTKLKANKVRLNGIRGAISLFIPPIDVDISASLQEIDEKDTRLTLGAAPSDSPDSLDTSMSRLSRSLSDISSAYVVIFTADADTSKAVIGAYFPVPSKTTHIFFQLQPRFRVLRWANPKVLRVDLITADEKASIGKFAANEGSVPLNSAPYWIGNPLELGTSIRVDPSIATATLTNGNGCYTGIPGANERGNPGKSWDVTIQKARMYIFVVAGAGNKKD